MSDKQISKEDAGAVLAALGEEFLVDIEAVHDGKGGYFIEFTTLANALVNPSEAWLGSIAEYASSHDISD